MHPVAFKRRNQFFPGFFGLSLRLAKASGLEVIVAQGMEYGTEKEYPTGILILLSYPAFMGCTPGR